MPHTLTQDIPTDWIEEAERYSKVQVQNGGEISFSEKEEMMLQDDYISIYRKCLDPYVAARRCGVTSTRIRKWLKRSPVFIENFLSVREEILSELESSAMIRAIGYTIPDSEEEGGIAVDGSGKPIYKGASDKLAEVMLKAHKPDVYNPDSNTPKVPVKGVVIVMDHDDDIEEGEFKEIESSQQ